MANTNWTDGSDNWNTAADWSTGAVPGSGDDVTIPADGDPQVTSNVGTVASVTVGGGTGDFGFLTMQGGALATMGDFTLSSTGTVDIDEVQGTGGSTLAVGGTLVTLSGSRLFAGSAAPSAATSITAAALSNAGSLSLASGASTLTSLDVGSAAGFGTAGTLTGGVSLSGDAQIVFQGGGQITTLAAGSGLDLTGSAASIADAGGGVNSALGTLTTLDGGLTLQDGATLTTTPTLTVAGGVQCTIESYQSATSAATLGGLSNAGMIEVEADESGAQLTISAAASNTGTVEIDGISGGTAVFDVGGGFDNAETFDVDTYDAEGGSSVTIGGTLTNEAAGAITIGNTTLDAATNLSAAALSNAGTLALSGGPSTATTLTVGSAAGFGTAGTVTGTVSLTDDAQIVFVSGTLGTIAAGASLTLSGAGASIADAGGAPNSALAGPLTIDGTLSLESNVALSTGAITIAQGGQLNAGDEAAGPTLTIGGALTIGSDGRAFIGGNANVLNEAASSTVSAQSLDVATSGNGGADDGSLSLIGSSDTSAPAVLDVASAAGFGTAGTITGAISLSGDSTIQFQTGAITSIAADSSLSLTGSNASIADANGSVNSALDLSSIAGGLLLQDGPTLSTGALDLTGSVDVYSTSSATSLTASSLTLGADAMLLASGSSSLIAIGSAAPMSLANRIEVQDGGTIQFGSGQITDISTGGVLFEGGGSVADAGGAANSALSTLSTIESNGFLDLERSSSLTTTVGLANAGEIALDTAGNDGGSSLTIGGTLTNSGQVLLGDYASGPPVTALASSDTLMANGLVNNGQVTLTGGAFFPSDPSGTATVMINGNATNNFLLTVGFVGTGAPGAYAAFDVTGAFTQNAGASTDTYGTINAGSFSLAANSLYFEELNGSSTNTFGVANVTGPISLGGATLDVSLDSGFTPTVGQSYTIINNEGSAAVSGTFAGLAQGATFEDDANGEEFSISYTGGDGNDVVLTDEGPAPVCFVQGTRIRAVRGDIAVEDLVVGDLAITAEGAARPIRWIGHRTIDCRNRPQPNDARPVRIAAHAFGASRPARDLLVSPGHSICVDVFGEVLIPASALVNGSTIVQLALDDVTYWHVELDGHDVILAENLPAESYLDMGNRVFFSQSHVVAFDASPDARAGTHGDFCRPFVERGPLLETVRARLAVRATVLADEALANELSWRLAA